MFEKSETTKSVMPDEAEAEIRHPVICRFSWILRRRRTSRRPE
jgi:hypothetical protein